MADVAAETAATTGRSMSVSNATIGMETAEGGSVGEVRLSVTWHALAAVEDERLVVGEPFASGYEPSGRLVVVAPEGYTIETSAPTPDDGGDGRATWIGSDLTGFEVAAAPSSASESTDVSTPGFGASVALLALAGAALALARRR
jgi:PGF-CTERM protein